jgi:hypothetical protein
MGKRRTCRSRPSTCYRDSVLYCGSFSVYALPLANKAELVPAGRWMIEGSRAPNPGILLLGSTHLAYADLRTRSEIATHPLLGLHWVLPLSFGPTHPCQLGVELLLLCSFERLFIGIYNQWVGGSFLLLSFMNIYKIERIDSCGYDEYDSAIVAAENESDARTIHPAHYIEKPVTDNIDDEYGSWVTLSKVKTTLIGTAIEGTPRGVIVASFNAG